MNALVPALAAALFSLAPISSVPVPGSFKAVAWTSTPAVSDVLPAPVEGMRVAANAALGDLLAEFSRVTSIHFSMDAATRQLLTNTDVGMLQDVQVPAERVYAFVEALLVERGLSLHVLHTSEPRLFAVRARGDFGWGTAWFVPRAELAGFADHPALRIGTEVRLAHVDLRQLANSLRALSTDAGFQAVVVGDTSTLYLSGDAQRVLDAVQLLERIDRASARPAQEAVPEDEAAGRTTREDVQRDG